MDSDDDCEETFLLLEVGDSFEFDLGYLLAAIPIANVLQYLYILAILVTVKTKSKSINDL